MAEFSIFGGPLSVPFWRAQIKSYLGLNSELRKGNIDTGLFTTRYQCNSRIKKGKKIGGLRKIDNRYIGNKDLH